MVANKCLRKCWTSSGGPLVNSLLWGSTLKEMPRGRITLTSSLNEIFFDLLRNRVREMLLRPRISSYSRLLDRYLKTSISLSSDISFMGSNMEGRAQICCRYTVKFCRSFSIKLATFYAESYHFHSFTRNNVKVDMFFRNFSFVFSTGMVSFRLPYIKAR